MHLCISFCICERWFYLLNSVNCSKRRDVRSTLLSIRWLLSLVISFNHWQTCDCQIRISHRVIYLHVSLCADMLYKITNEIIFANYIQGKGGWRRFVLTCNKTRCKEPVRLWSVDCSLLSWIFSTWDLELESMSTNKKALDQIQSVPMHNCSCAKDKHVNIVNIQSSAIMISSSQIKTDHNNTRGDLTLWKKKKYLDICVTRKAIQLIQQFQHSSLDLSVTTLVTVKSLGTDGINLINEHNAWWLLFC